MPDFTADNPYMNLKLNFATLCRLSNSKGEPEIKPEHQPLLIGVEAVKERNAPPTAPQIATRYCLAFPGSGFMRIALKVEEAAPSITQETLDKCGGAVRVSVEGFTSGVFLTNDGGARPYFKATRITPITTQTQK